MESAHIKAIKEPWRQSNHYEALGQMLVTNQRLSKLAASRVNFRSCRMLTGSVFENSNPPPLVLPPPLVDADDDDDGAVDEKNIWGEVVLARKPITSIPFEAHGLATHFNLPQFPDLISHFLHQQHHLAFNDNLDKVPIADCP
ncbi:hypothetical protein C0991_007282 [Blastosporella zonata]|nr:hypothetical protein C0991_007282 [Blastosporella zonata]